MKIKLTILFLMVMIVLSPLSAFAQQSTRQQRYHAKYGCNPWESCHNALQFYREPQGLVGAVAQLGNSYGVWPASMTPQNPLVYPNKWCHPNDNQCNQQGQQQFTPQPNHYAPPAQQCGWYTLQGQQQPAWLCQP